MKELINNLKEKRTAQGITQEALAERVGVTRQTIIAIEKAKFVPSVKLALSLAAALEIPVSELFWLGELTGGSQPEIFPPDGKTQ
jgi:putative transcriptional regulator